MPARDDNRRQQVKDMREKGMSYAAIGKQLSITATTVYRMVHQMGLPGRIELADDGRKSNRIDVSRRQQVREMREHGMTYEAIGKALNPPVTRQAVFIIATGMGLRKSLETSLDKDAGQA